MSGVTASENTSSGMAGTASEQQRQPDKAERVRPVQAVDGVRRDARNQRWLRSGRGAV